MKLVLGSSSRDRKKCFERANLSFEIIPSNFDESMIINDDPIVLVKDLALKKARNVLQLWNDHYSKNKEPAIIIGADTMVFYDGKLIGKPKDKQDAFRIISNLSGQYHDIYTGVAIIQSETLQQEVFVDHSRIHFQQLEPSEIWDYLNLKDEFTGRAGAYSLRDRASLFIDEIQGSPTNVIGLPMAKLRRILKNFGVNLLNYNTE
ncbi:dTTP/UTP pyrophosphatase [Candidatus Lokiarchaeum ossiferum]|uniref:Nucleoside triphosphate pyrophosphatase n=1 Tax=Candidatus Lokiarchaeum ossiferum TaxID=2951803 RepID=A0ABY6HWW7_9ARCH|nr:dTTP/UTP pyrophosphatase [Candidatus Lokiarchaeum sp. B-35]